MAEPTEDGLELMRESVRNGDAGCIYYAPRRVTNPTLERFREALQSLINAGWLEWHDISGEQDTQWMYTPTEAAKLFLKKCKPDETA